MFERFVRFAQARRALDDQRFDEALRLLDVPEIRDTRRADSMRRKALGGIVERARRRAENGSADAALVDLDRVLKIAPDFDDALLARDEVAGRRDELGRRAVDVRDLQNRVRELTERGELSQAEALLDTWTTAGRGSGDDSESLRRWIASRREVASTLRDEAQAATDRGELAMARDRLGRARAMERGLPHVEHLAVRLAAKTIRGELPRLERLAREAGPSRAAGELIELIRALPELESDTDARAFLTSMLAEGQRAVVDALRAGDVSSALRQFDELDPRIRNRGGLAATMADVRGALEAERGGSFAAASETFDAVASRFDSAALRNRARALGDEQARVDEVLASVRDQVAAGAFAEARAALLELLERHPLHEVGRREMTILQQGAEERDRRLAIARDGAKTGRLSEAAGLLAAMAVPGPEGDEPRLLLRDVQGRMDLVDSGLQQVMRSLHGRDSSSREGLVHCLARVDELRKIQVDHPELERVRAALAAEIDGLEAIDAARKAVFRGDRGAAVAAIANLAGLDEGLLQPGRLDARILGLADTVFDEASEAAAAGRPRTASAWLQVLREPLFRRSSVGERARELEASIARREGEASLAVADARAALARRDLNGAEDALRVAEGADLDGVEVGRIREEIAELRRRSAGLEDVEALAQAKDFEAASHRLAGMGPTPELLRTRIFDLKKTLAKAQGLETAFVLRVDEGGELLVVRGESVTIGNVRDRRADLPVLANLAGCHARFSRSMSFHGGMQDKVQAERGRVLFRGEEIASHVLRDGDRIGLGEAVQLDYRVPSRRSLTSELTIRGGFQIAGTDRILLFKDRGRDGRILIGPGTDTHVRVSHAENEIEIYASKDGQIRVRFGGQGEMDGKPFSGEHPVTAGEVVRCGLVTFVLTPWNRD